MPISSSNFTPIFMDSQTISSLQQPRRLIDFLQDQNLPFPRPRKSTISLFIHAFKSSSILPRTISRRFSNKNKSCSCPPEPTMSRTTSVTVKDILRWRSFRDIVDPMANINVPVTIDSPSRCTNTTSSTTTSCGTPTSSWSDSDFTVGDSPIWCRGFSSDIEVDFKKSFRVNVAGDTKDAKNGQVHEEEEEEEQYSPISVLDFAHEDEETFSSFHQSLANMKRRNTMLKQRIQDFETLIEVEDRYFVTKDIEVDDVAAFEIEEKAIQLMNHVKTTSSKGEWDPNMDFLLLDLFRDELIMTKGVKSGCEVESRLLRMAKSWVKGVDDRSLEWELEGTREVCILEMGKSGNWKDFEGEQQEIGIELEKILLNNLLDELTMDLRNA